MRRKLFNVATVVSLALCVAACVLWVRSYRVWEGGFCTKTSTEPDGTWRTVEAGFLSTQGALGLSFERRTRRSPTNPALATSAPTGLRWRYTGHPPPNQALAWWEWHRPQWRAGLVPAGRNPPKWAALLRLPYWIICPLLACLPGWWLVRTKSRRRGLCPTCGYDLRATPDRCPECGTVPKPAQSAA